MHKKMAKNKKKDKKYMKDFMCSFNQVLKKLDETCYSLWLFNRATMFIELIVIHDSKQTTI